MRTLTTILTALAVTCAGLLAAPAAAAEPPWQPATDLYAHMAGEDGGSGFEQAVRDMVTDHIKDTAPDFVDPYVDDAAQRYDPTADGGTTEEAPSGPDPDEQATGEREDDGQAADESEAYESDASWDDDRDGGGNDPDGAPESHYSGHPVAADDGHPRRGPCVEAGGALVEVREHAGGQVHPLGVACVAPEHARPDRATVIREAARRQVRGMDLPGGRIAAAPDEGLAWLETEFRLSGTRRGPASLTVHGDRLGVTFVPAVHAWGLGDGTGADHAGTGGATTARHTYRRGGVYQVTVRTSWNARVTLDGRPLTTVTGLVSRTTISYPVSELRAILTD